MPQDNAGVPYRYSLPMPGESELKVPDPSRPLPTHDKLALADLNKAQVNATRRLLMYFASCSDRHSIGSMDETKDCGIPLTEHERGQVCAELGLDFFTDKILQIAQDEYLKGVPDGKSYAEHYGTPLNPPV